MSSITPYPRQGGSPSNKQFVTSSFTKLLSWSLWIASSRISFWVSGVEIQQRPEKKNCMVLGRGDDGGFVVAAAAVASLPAVVKARN